MGNAGSNTVAAKVVEKARPKHSAADNLKPLTPCRDCPRLSNPAFRKFSPEQLRFMQELKTGEVVHKAGEAILREGQKSEYLFTILEGWAIRYKLVSDGGRQILNVALPGDLIGLQSTVFGEMQHSIEATTTVRACVIRRDRLFDLYTAHPGLAFDVTWLAAREEAIVSELMANVGQQPAFIRMAFIFAHIFHRAQVSGLTEGNGLAFPLKQDDIADMLGLSMVHTNRTWGKLRATNCIAWNRGRLVVNDVDRLHEFGKFSAAVDTPRPFL